MDQDKLRSIISPQVEEYFNKNWISTYVPYEVALNAESKDHIINIGTSIMMNVLGYNTYPGSFIQAILRNDLQGSVGQADHINIKALAFYATMKYNLSIELPK